MQSTRRILERGYVFGNLFLQVGVGLLGAVMVLTRIRRKRGSDGIMHLVDYWPVIDELDQFFIQRPEEKTRKSKKTAVVIVVQYSTLHGWPRNGCQ